MEYTIEQLGELTQQLTLNEICNGRVHFTGEGWTNVSIKQDSKKAHLMYVATLIKGRSKYSLGRIYNILDSGALNTWYGERFIYCKYSEKIKYVAGQDYVSELTTIRKDFK